MSESFKLEDGCDTTHLFKRIILPVVWRADGGRWSKDRKREMNSYVVLVV